MAKQNQSQSSDAKEGTESDQGNEVAIKADVTSTVETQQPAPVVQKSVSLDEHHGHGGPVSYTHLTLPTICSV